MPIKLEAIFSTPATERFVPKMPEALPLLAGKAPGIIARSKTEEEAIESLLSVLQPYSEGGKFILTFMDSHTFTPVDFEHQSYGALGVDFQATIH